MAKDVELQQAVDNLNIKNFQDDGKKQTIKDLETIRELHTALTFPITAEVAREKGIQAFHLANRLVMENIELRKRADRLVAELIKAHIDRTNFAGRK